MSASDTEDFLRLAGELTENCRPRPWPAVLASTLFLIRACLWVIVAGAVSKKG